MTRRNCGAGPGSKVDAPEAASGPGWKVQEVSRVGAQGGTSKSKLLARGNAAGVQQRLAGRFGGKFEAEGGRAGPGGKVDTPELSSGPGWEIQEVSRVGAQGVTSKSKLLALAMPRLHSSGLQVDSGGSLRWKVC